MEESCQHSKTFTWQSETFTKQYNTEYEYCNCSICGTSVYTGQFRFVSLNDKNKEIVNPEEMKKVSKHIKKLYAKSDKSLSLKDFARQVLIKNEDPLISNWFKNKK